MVEAGETGGFLDVVLAQIADFQAREKELRSKVMTALLYPAILLVLASCVLVFLLVFFIRGFRPCSPSSAGPCHSHADHRGDQRRTPGYGLILLLGVGLAGFLVRSWIVSAKGRRTWEGLILRCRRWVRWSRNSPWPVLPHARTLLAPASRSSTGSTWRAARLATRSSWMPSRTRLTSSRRARRSVESGRMPTLFSGSVLEMVSSPRKAGASIRSWCALPTSPRAIWIVS